MTKKLYIRYWTVLHGTDAYYIFCEDVFGGPNGHINQSIGTVSMKAFDSLPADAKRECVSKSVELITIAADAHYARPQAEVECNPRFRRAQPC